VGQLYEIAGCELTKKEAKALDAWLHSGDGPNVLAKVLNHCRDEAIEKSTRMIIQSRVPMAYHDHERAEQRGQKAAYENVLNLAEIVEEELQDEV